MYAEACECFEAAIRAAEPEVPLALRCALSESRSRTGALEGARDGFLAVARAARSAGDAALLSRAALGVGAIPLECTFESEDAFVAALVRDIPPAPEQQAAIVAANRAGRALAEAAP